MLKNWFLCWISHTYNRLILSAFFGEHLHKRVSSGYLTGQWKRVFYFQKDWSDRHWARFSGSWLLLRTSRRAVFVLPHSESSFSGATVPESVNWCQNPVRHPAWPYEPVYEKRLAGRAKSGVHYLHDRGCQEGVVLRRQQSDQAAPGTRKVWSDWTKTQRSGKAKFGVCEELFGRIIKINIPESWFSRFWRLQKRKSRPFKITM